MVKNKNNDISSHFSIFATLILGEGGGGGGGEEFEAFIIKYNELHHFAC